MIFVIFGIVLILGFMAADAMLDYIFVFIYALAAMAITNNTIHLSRYYKKYGSICSHDITGSLLYLLMALGALLVQHFFL